MVNSGIIRQCCNFYKGTLLLIIGSRRVGRILGFEQETGRAFPISVADGRFPGAESGLFDHFAAYLDFFYRSSQEYALIANCYTIANIDFRKILERLIGNPGTRNTVIKKRRSFFRNVPVKNVVAHFTD